MGSGKYGVQMITEGTDEGAQPRIDGFKLIHNLLFHGFWPF
jgi:hypothetical protein